MLEIKNPKYKQVLKLRKIGECMKKQIIQYKKVVF